MFNGERPRSENLEAGNNPEGAVERTSEQILGTAVAEIEKRDAQNSPSWIKKHKKGLKITGGVVAGIGGVVAGAVVFPKTALGIYGALHIYPYFMFFKKFIEKRGKMTFGEGYKVAEEMFGGKKDKK